ncbi:hypothetical protein ACLB2K_054855 [Fragaria x ananassa]
MEVASEPTRVQTLAQAGLTQVPPQYIQPPHNRPNHPSSSSAVPSITLFGLDPTRRDTVRTSIAQACRDWGAFHVTDHGIPASLLHDIRRVGLTFFNDSPVHDKLRYACDPTSAASEGYGSRMLEKDDTVLDWRDYFDHHTLPLTRRDPTRWPDFPPEYRRVVAEYSDKIAALARELLGLIAESLELKTQRLEEEAHLDFGAITLLVQDEVGGLEVLKDNEWVPVTPLGGDAIVVLLADQTEIMTNGKYKSSVHRAITNSNRPRLSVATFHDPAKTVKVSPASELISQSTPPLYGEVVYGDYVSSWYTKGPEGKRNIDALLLE